MEHDSFSLNDKIEQFLYMLQHWENLTVDDIIPQVFIYSVSKITVLEE